MTSFLQKFIVGQTKRRMKREREREGERRDPLFLILLSTLMSSTLEVQERDSFTEKDISRFLFALILPLFVLLFPYIVLFSVLMPTFGHSAMRKEKE